MNWKRIIEKKYKGKIKVLKYEEFMAFSMEIMTVHKTNNIRKEFITLPLNSKLKNILKAIDDTMVKLEVK